MAGTHLHRSAVALVALLFSSRLAAQTQVVIDINEPNHLRLRFEQIPLIVGDPASRATMPLDLNFPGIGVEWQGLDFSALTPGGTGYAVAGLSFGGSRVAAEGFPLSAALFDPLARLPISDEPVLAQTWDFRAGELPGGPGTTPPISYVWEVNFAVGAGFGLFGSLEAMVIPEPGPRALLILGGAVVAALLLRRSPKRLPVRN